MPVNICYCQSATRCQAHIQKQWSVSTHYGSCSYLKKKKKKNILCVHTGCLEKWEKDTENSNERSYFVDYFYLYVYSEVALLCIVDENILYLSFGTEHSSYDAEQRFGSPCSLHQKRPKLNPRENQCSWKHLTSWISVCATYRSSNPFQLCSSLITRWK